MNMHFHPTQWFHHTGREHVHLREIFHSEVFWIVTAMLAIMITLAVLAIVFGAPNATYMPRSPYMPFPY